MAGGKPPDYIVGALDKRNDVKSNNVGAAWIQDNGTIQIVLNSFQTFDTFKSDILLTLFPNDGNRRSRFKEHKPVSPKEIPKANPDDEIPF